MRFPPEHFCKPLTALARAAVALLMGCALLAVPQSALAEPPAEFTITLSKESQPKLARPKLNALKAKAAADGITLRAAIERLAQSEKPDEGVTLPDIPVDDLSVIELTDLAQLAKDKGIGLERSIDLYGWHDQFSQATARLRALLPGQLAGYEIVDTPEGDRAGWIGFKGEIPSAAVEIAKTIPAPVELVGNKGYSEEDLEGELDRTARELPTDGPHRVLSYDIRTGTISITVDPGAAITTENEKADFVRAFTPSASKIPGVSFSVEVKKTGLRFKDTYARGGGYFNGGAPCTTGFNVTKDGAHSPTTAGHCAPNTCTFEATACDRQYANQSGDGGSTPIKFKLRHEGHYGDFARYGPGTFTATDTFYYGWGVKRYANTVASTGDIYKGKPICKFGRNSGPGCTTVYKKGLLIDNIHYLVAVDSEITVGGDSGGPWFTGGQAVGMLSGATDGLYEGAVRDLISPVHLIPSALGGWQVRTH